MRRAARIDGQHRAIVAALRAAGASVRSTAALGKGFPDLIVARPYDHTTFLLEIKAPLGPLGGKSDHGQSMNEDQIKFGTEWQGEFWIVRSPQQAVDTLRLPELRMDMIRSKPAREILREVKP
jgi:hypothetical protein